jgi:hypothetical protein
MTLPLGFLISTDPKNHELPAHAPLARGEIPCFHLVSMIRLAIVNRTGRRLQQDVRLLTIAGTSGSGRQFIQYNVLSDTFALG